MTAPKRALLEGLAVSISTAGLATWSPAGEYADTDIAIWLKRMQTTPDRGVMLGFTIADIDPLARWGQGTLQLISRGDRTARLSVDDIADPIVFHLLALVAANFGSVTVNQVSNPRSLDSGIDFAKRAVRVDQFTIDVDYQA